MIKALVKKLNEKHMTISTAESCTGGMIGASITSVAGASSVYNEGYITYSNDAKEKNLGVLHTTLETYGAVSKQTAIEMADGVRKKSNADIGISVTGIAGPTGGTDEKPVGLVYIGVATKDVIQAHKFIFSGSRDDVRKSTVETAIRLALDKLA